MKGALVWANPRPGVEIEGFDVEGRATLAEDRRIELGRYQACDLVIRGAIIGGRRNCLFEHEPEGLWRYQHLGGGLPNFLNGANTGVTPCFLADGDVIEPEG
ncbi:MAG TPA: FHA domain-containing protein, partial [bacterium]|nr:FHA domain-containing protein [bacterium]